MGENDLDLSRRNLTHLDVNFIPDNIDSLLLYNNELTNIEGLSINKSISVLSVSHNKIKEIKTLPETIEKIFISNNPLTDISGIWKCKKLKVISFDQPHLYNEIKTLCKIKKCDFDYWDESINSMGDNEVHDKLIEEFMDGESTYHNV